MLPIDVIMRDELERKRGSWELGYETKELIRRTFRKVVDTETMLEMMR